MKQRQPGRGHTIPFRRGAPLPRQLRQLAVQVDAGGLTLGEMLACLEEPGLLVLCVILATPFLLPVSIPGSSLPFGLLIALIGAGVSAGRTPWLPVRLLRKTLHGRRWAKVLIGAARLTLWLNKKSAAPAAGTASPHWIHGLALTLAGLLLTLPLPVPLSNTLPGISVFLLAGGMLRRSRPLLAAGHAMLALSILYLSFIGILGVAGAKTLLHRWISF